MKKRMNRKQLNSEIDRLQSKQLFCNAGSKKWNQYRLKINQLKVELDQRIIRGEI